jgi:predicted O-methyltransferase YrrM
MSQPSSLPLLRPREELSGVAVMPLIDFSSIYSYGRIISAYETPAQASIAERLFLFAAVVAKSPSRVLEIGFRYGGTSFLILCALADAGGGGRLVSIDPEPESVLDFSHFGDRFRLIQGRSPDDLPAALAVLGGPVDLCFVDGDHDYAGVLADLEAVGPHMAMESFLLLHDAQRPTVRHATDEFLRRHAPRVVDCGLVAPTTNEEQWGGLRMLRMTNAAGGARSGWSSFWSRRRRRA